MSRWRIRISTTSVVLLGLFSLSGCGKSAPVKQAAARSVTPGSVSIAEAVPGAEPAILAVIPGRVANMPVRRCFVRGHEGENGPGFRSEGIIVPGPQKGSATCALSLWQAIKAAKTSKVKLIPGVYEISVNCDSRPNHYVPDAVKWAPDDFVKVTITKAQLDRAAAMLQMVESFPT